MRRTLLGLLAVPFLLTAESLDKPEKLTIHTWVREDIFAGWMAKDAEALARGERKLEHFLASNPTHSSALAWKFLATQYHLRDAIAKGNKAEYQKRLAESKVLREKAIAANPNDVAVYIIVGGGMIMSAYYVPEEDKQWLYRDGRELLRKVPVMQGAAFDKLPPHMRGETWSLLAYASDRLGDKEDRDALIDTMFTKLQGSPYESRAKRWKTLPALNSETDNMCITCHEPGRLKNVQARLSASSAAK
ncbi:MAG: hypothetical protein JST93_02620 [Acidobacteria bacterium]|nr:hypothetical protein [Acidobacteriota bacterium]